MRRSTKTTKILLLTPPILLTYTTHRFLSTLEAKYPPTDPTTTTSLGLRTPRNPATQHCPAIDVFEARAVPVQSLLKRYRTLLQAHPQSPPITTETTELENKEKKRETLLKAWILTFLNTPPLLHEASIFNLFKNRTYDPGDTGLITFSPSTTPSQKMLKEIPILNDILTIESFTPSNPLPSLLLSWTLPPEPIHFFETLSRWGYPFRLMSGGRHELSISPIYTHNGEEVVDVRFASAHDYEVIEHEGGVDSQKMIPRWVGRLHRGYARFLLHAAVGDVGEPVKILL
ncbi:uncharacterized protein BO80DRAFT_423287 [Aspergillus ibericus CBS 121593]|uniref:Uncharacterized protein n=1 Tax=Aspergillus ibericus CBS 121593 TaxID=1448316 RepID=A0A395H6K8_9EURO|nr:hypothetical protein BO80DRAFT_423287 [Aspergillus ibericus CBS 121593]RAL02805.1 hypothetical protein BO80DRAFT_423287 [Aspergillus ibericus CBS 121593]